MDPVGFTASILTLIGTVDTCWSIVCAIKNGPKEVESLAASLTRLSNTLKNLQDIDETGEEWTDLKDDVEACNAALQEVSTRLGKFQHEPSDGRTAKLMKSLRTGLNRGEFGKCHVDIQSMINALNLKLSVLQRYGAVLPGDKLFRDPNADSPL